MASPRRADDCGGLTIGRLGGDPASADEEGQCGEAGPILHAPPPAAPRGGRRDAGLAASVAEAASCAGRCKLGCLIFVIYALGFCTGWAGNDALGESSRSVSANPDGLSQDASLSPTTQQFLASLRVCGACETFRRFGERHDGGYLTCMDGWTPGSVTAALSMGVEQHDMWSKDMSVWLLASGASGATVVHQFDCTVPKGQACPGCQFHKVCIAPEGDTAKPNFWSLSKVLEETGLAQAPDRSIIMKMDIENAEWLILATEAPSVLSKFQQVILEFHQLGHRLKHGLYAQVVQTMLNAGFRVVHIHGNNAQGMYEVPKSRYQVPRLLEVTFLAGARPIPCQADQTLHHLDADNLPDATSLPMAHLPAA
mmetsp:Transcript_1542/g.4370  ORF Transcript_1542/g.4370 Transcript_1542/m.4370 type:complete len:368 (+) Transcript_1542:64-1167(+)